MSFSLNKTKQQRNIFSSLCLKVLPSFVLLAKSEKTSSKYCLIVKKGERQVVFSSKNVKGQFDSMLRQVVSNMGARWQLFGFVHVTFGELSRYHFASAFCSDQLESAIFISCKIENYIHNFAFPNTPVNFCKISNSNYYLFLAEFLRFRRTKRWCSSSKWRP